MVRCDVSRFPLLFSAESGTLIIIRPAYFHQNHATENQYATVSNMSKNKHSLEASTKRLSDEGFMKRTLRDMKLAFWLFRQRDVSLFAKLVPIVALAYALAPVDLIPDFIPVLGQIDDIAFIMIGVRLFLRLAPPPVVGRYQADKLGLAPIETEL